MFPILCPTRALLLQGEPRDAAVNFDTYRILQRHCAAFIARQHNAERAIYAIARPSVCLSVGVSEWISQKRLKLRSCNLHRRVAQSL